MSRIIDISKHKSETYEDASFDEDMEYDEENAYKLLGIAVFLIWMLTFFLN